MDSVSKEKACQADQLVLTITNRHLNVVTGSSRSSVQNLERFGRSSLLVMDVEAFDICEIMRGLPFK